MGMQEVAEVSEAEAVMDHAPQDMLLGTEDLCERRDRQLGAGIEALGNEPPSEALEHTLLEATERDGGIRLDRIEPVDDPKAQEARDRHRSNAIDDRKVCEHQRV